MPTTPHAQRIRFRPWASADFRHFLSLYGDRDVALFLKSRLTPETAMASLVAQIEHEKHHGFSNWVIERKSDGELIGDCGLMRFNYVFDDGQKVEGIELGYHLRPHFWGQGYATEAAVACLKFGFVTCGISEISAFVQPANTTSVRVLEKIALSPTRLGIVGGIKVQMYSAQADVWRAPKD